MNWVRETLSARSGQLSSKRVCGTSGFILSMIVLGYCTWNEILAPEMIDAFMLSCMGLLGVDSVTGIWKSDNINNNNNINISNNATASQENEPCE